MVGLTQQEIENWVKKDSSNSISNKSTFNYRFAATIPSQIIELLLSKQEEESFYFGSVLRVYEENNVSFFTLGFYTVFYTGVGEEFIIARTNYGLKDYQVNWKDYINSTEYINLDITFKNLNLSGTFYAQCTKMNRLYGLIQVDQDINYIEGRTALFDEDKTFIYYAVTDLDTNFYYNIPAETWTSFGITPSVLKLAQYNPFGNILQKTKEFKRKANNKDKKVIKPEIDPASR